MTADRSPFPRLASAEKGTRLCFRPFNLDTDLISMQTLDTDALESSFGYRFRQPERIHEALRHRSFVNEHPEEDLVDNERLEFLGDAVLSLVVSHVLMERFPDMTEGDLSRTRANLINEPQLAKLARSVELGSLIQLGKGENLSGGRDKNSILSDTFEAVVAAIYLDGGFQAVFDVITRRFGSTFDGVQGRDIVGDYKSRLQELAQTRQKTVPSYRVVEESGPDHDKTFCVELILNGISAQGIGKSKKLAEQDAARKALEMLSDHG